MRLPLCFSAALAFFMASAPADWPPDPPAEDDEAELEADDEEESDIFL